MNWKKLHEQLPSEKCWSLLLISLWKLLNQRIKSNSSSNRCGNIHWQNYLFTYKYLTDMSPHLNRVVITKWWYFHQWEEAVRWQLANVCVWSLAWASQPAIMLQSVALQTYWSDQHDTPQAYGSDQHDTPRTYWSDQNDTPQTFSQAELSYSGKRFCFSHLEGDDPTQNLAIFLPFSQWNINIEIEK